MLSTIRFLKKHVGISIVLLFILSGIAWASLSAHSMAVLDLLFLELDPNADGTAADATIPVADITLDGVSLIAQLAGKQATVTDGSLADGVVMKDDLHENAKWVREAFTTNADPYAITPTGDWNDYHEYYCIITTHQANVTLQLTETGPPVNQTKAHIYITSGFDADMTDIDNQQELIPDGITKTIEIGERIIQVLT